MSQHLQIRYEFAPSAGKSYTRIPFQVPPGIEYIIVRGRYSISQSTQGNIDIGLIDAEQQIRGWSGNLNRQEQIFLGEEQASYGYLANPLQAGTWEILLGDSRRHNSHIVVELDVELRPCEPRIVRGDIHGHSFYSDGAHSIETKLSMAEESGLDFLGFTDHNSVAQNFCLPQNPEVLLLPSCEITTYNGHVNIFGYRERRIPHFMCHNSEEMRQVLRELREQGVRVQLNHPVRMGDIAGCHWGWDDDMPFDWMEIWNGNWNQNNVANLAMWQGFLEQGRFLPAVGNSDFHSIEFKQQGYPCNNVWASKKTSTAIYEALAKGRNYITAEPLPERSFAAFLVSGTESIPFGSSVSPDASLQFRLSTSQTYLAERETLLLRVWNENGLCWEKRGLQFEASTPMAGGHNRLFSIQLEDLPPSATVSLKGKREPILHFLRFELFECPTDSEETALLLSNPIFRR
ncbi:MAG: CehA/McbA family metallohydrolase [Spirochaetota bacterium]